MARKQQKMMPNGDHGKDLLPEVGQTTADGRFIGNRKSEDRTLSVKLKRKVHKLKGQRGLISIVPSSSEALEKLEERIFYCVTEFLKRKIMPLRLENSPDNNNHQEQSNKVGDELLQWLETKSERSSFFVSFGNEYILNKQKIKEISLGLELSNVNFIWILRIP
ncbi:hypothetical protein M9H77_17184 [Catharanthus roseus]|uniref:Uncharacterized protein n=1 Tax=Catharanthus roseus TaxID=4058 RepID=A0ACC0B3W9_CATRO|nr:hypothetical protein M9H77_17184 [Catharanthus roseus]